MEQTDTGAESLPVLVFDLDGTLYDASNGYVDYIRSNIFEFMYEMVRFSLVLLNQCVEFGIKGGIC